MEVITAIHLQSEAEEECVEAIRGAYLERLPRPFFFSHREGAIRIGSDSIPVVAEPHPNRFQTFVALYAALLRKQEFDYLLQFDGDSFVDTHALQGFFEYLRGARPSTLHYMGPSILEEEEVPPLPRSSARSNGRSVMSGSSLRYCVSRQGLLLSRRALERLVAAAHGTDRDPEGNVDRRIGRILRSGSILPSLMPASIISPGFSPKAIDSRERSTAMSHRWKSPDYQRIITEALPRAGGLGKAELRLLAFYLSMALRSAPGAVLLLGMETEQDATVAHRVVGASATGISPVLSSKKARGKRWKLRIFGLRLFLLSRANARAPAAARSVRAFPLSFCLINAQTALADIRGDFAAVNPLIAPGGFVAIQNDRYGDFPNTWLHCREIPRLYGWSHVMKIDSLSIFQKPNQ